MRIQNSFKPCPGPRRPCHVAPDRCPRQCAVCAHPADIPPPLSRLLPRANVLAMCPALTIPPTLHYTDVPAQSRLNSPQRSPPAHMYTVDAGRSLMRMPDRGRHIAIARSMSGFSAPRRTGRAPSSSPREVRSLFHVLTSSPPIRKEDTQSLPAVTAAAATSGCAAERWSAHVKRSGTYSHEAGKGRIEVAPTIMSAVFLSRWNTFCCT